MDGYKQMEIKSTTSLPESGASYIEVPLGQLETQPPLNTLLTQSKHPDESESQHPSSVHSSAHLSLPGSPVCTWTLLTGCYGYRLKKRQIHSQGA